MHMKQINFNCNCGVDSEQFKYYEAIPNLRCSYYPDLNIETDDNSVVDDNAVELPW